MQCNIKSLNKNSFAIVSDKLRLYNVTTVLFWYMVFVSH